jgi:hypothetical protein
VSYRSFGFWSTRVLTDEELKEVGQYWSSLNILNIVTYNAAETLQELHDALLIQQNASPR